METLKYKSIKSLERFIKANPPKEYEQSEKYRHYQQRVVDHYNNLFTLWNKKNNHGN